MVRMSGFLRVHILQLIGWDVALQDNPTESKRLIVPNDRRAYVPNSQSTRHCFCYFLIIMAQQQHAADVHPDELCPPNKRYDLMDANKKVDLEHVQCPPESKILTNIIKNHPLRFSIAASSSVPWIYMAQFWHTLKEDGSKYQLLSSSTSNCQQS
ncbi:hypothetical protein Tco_0763368 [Tanacetum coccineum]